MTIQHTIFERNLEKNSSFFERHVLQRRLDLGPGYHYTLGRHVLQRSGFTDLAYVSQFFKGFVLCLNLSKEKGSRTLDIVIPVMNSYVCPSNTVLDHGHRQMYYFCWWKTWFRPSRVSRLFQRVCHWV